MKRLLLLLLLVPSLASLARATTYYISTSGSDSNTGTTTGSPWIHIPGQGGCTANCATKQSAGVVAGDRFIYRGGDHWHVSNSGAGTIFGASTISYSGTASGCDPLNNLNSTCVYIGVDKTYFTGGSWARPIIDFDNPLAVNRAAVTSCTYNDTGANSNNGLLLYYVTGNYITFDNFEIIGWCQGNNINKGWNFVAPVGTGITVENMYQHGWTHVATCTNA